jgi:hypothetical protein
MLPKGIWRPTSPLERPKKHIEGLPLSSSHVLAMLFSEILTEEMHFGDVLDEYTLPHID